MITETHLYLALEAHRISEQGTKLEQLAIDSILFYVLRQLDEEGLDIEDNHLIAERVQSLINDHLIDHLIGEGIVHEDLEGVLELTKLGEIEAERLRKCS